MQHTRVIRHVDKLFSGAEEEKLSQIVKASKPELLALVQNTTDVNEHLEDPMSSLQNKIH